MPSRITPSFKSLPSSVSLSLWVSKSDFNPLMRECCVAARAYTGLLFVLFYY
jgi:hypothetical protein